MASITTTKQNFLTTQIRLLNTPLQTPSSTFNAPTIPPKTVNDILARTNTHLRTHNRTIYPHLAIRHVAEQVESLYWNEVLAEREADDENNGTGATETVVRRDTDFCTRAGVEGLKAWADVTHAVSDEEEEDEDESRERKAAEERYEELKPRLVELCARRNKMRAKVERYTALKGMLEPFEDATVKVQPNLVTRDGELGREMERMRGLVARVGARMGEGGSGKVVVGDGEGERWKRRKLAALNDRVDVLVDAGG